MLLKNFILYGYLIVGRVRHFKLQADAVPLTYILNSVLSGTSKVQAYAVPLTCILNSALSGTLSFRLMLYR